MKYKIFKRIIRKAKNIFNLKVSSRYQENSNSYLDQFRLLEKNIDLSIVKTALDVGCNQGLLSNKLADCGIFTIGIDTHLKFTSFVFNEHRPLAFSYFEVNKDNVSFLPNSDLVLIFSVHHLWVKGKGDDYAKAVVQTLVDKANKFFVIEFPSRAEKFGYEKGKFFIDNDEISVCRYAEDWLNDLSYDGSLEYLGINTMGGTAPNRYLFIIKKNNKKDK